MKSWFLTVLIAMLLLTACSDPPPKTIVAKPTPAGQSAISPDRHDYLSAEMRARAHAQQQLGEVQKERRQQIEEEKQFDTPKARKAAP